MSAYLVENVYTHTFTPREYQLELLDSAKKRNTIICSSSSPAKAFIIIKLLQELSHEMRSASGKKALFIMDVQNISVMSSHVQLLTDLIPHDIIDNVDIDAEKSSIDSSTTVILTTLEMCSELLKMSLLQLEGYKLIVFDCLSGGDEHPVIKQLMERYRNIPLLEKPKILGLVSGLLSSELKPNRLEAEMHRLERLLDSSVDTSSEILTLVRLSCRPSEYIIECPISIPIPIEEQIRCLVMNCQAFLSDHRFDPSEIYDEELVAEFRAMPDPKEEPLNLLNQFLDVLDDLGLWMADRVAYTMLINIEKFKVKVPYERHFLLLCMTSSVLVSIRSACETEFQSYTEKEKIFRFSTPKLIKFLHVLKQFKPCTQATPTVEEKAVETIETGKKRVKNCRNTRRPYAPKVHSDDNLCALIFLQNRYKVEALFALLCVMSKNDEDFKWIAVSFLVNKIADPVRDPHEAETEHKRQEEVLRKYRNRESNIMIATSALERGCDLPKCNLVIRFDLPTSFHSYIYSKARARAGDAHYLIFAKEAQVPELIDTLAEYNQVENVLLKRCCSLEPDRNEESLADSFSSLCKPYRPNVETSNSILLTLSNAISLVNRYCAKLPSDTFTRLVPIWNESEVKEGGFICSIRLPINSPIKGTLTSPPMMNKLLARRAAAFMVCQLLHKMGELDDNLQPISKENFRPSREDWDQSSLEGSDDESSLEQRPGTTKRRQYYYKKIADVLLNCHPQVGRLTYFYKIVMKLTCPLPEEQNTRGRKIYPPENSPHGFGILTSKEIPQISAFPIFTRSGEVSVDLELCSQITIAEEEIEKIREFINYTFTSVLRLQKYLMLFSPEESVNSYLIVPTKDINGLTTVDFDFISLIYQYTKEGVHPMVIPTEERKCYKFDSEKYTDAVVMPWYRNQDQPQYFYVAEICSNLNPNSEFPGSDYSTFEEYYLRKYNIQIQNKEQYLLDVDHTSARLNFLTPRYVNRKGVALPTSSEATKRAKREKLDQKQILVPELCAVHPFSASLWRKAVCLPCILYRINALLLADQIRKTVAMEVALGQPKLDPEFKWPPLSFGWSLADVLKRSKQEQVPKIDAPAEQPGKVGKSKNDVEQDEDSDADDDEVLEIGTWSNEMADFDAGLRYASPTNWTDLQQTYDDGSFSDFDNSEDSESEWCGLKIEFTGDNVAEAVEDCAKMEAEFQLVDYSTSIYRYNDDSELSNHYKTIFHEECLKNKEHILSSGILIPSNSEFRKNLACSTPQLNDVAAKFPMFDSDTLFIEPVFREPHRVSTSIPVENIYNKTANLTYKFDDQPDLHNHPGPSPNILLQALTMSNANDGINLERLETIGDSFLKYAITTNLYSKYENVHEGKLSHLRSKQVSNLNLYRLGKRKNLGELMIATKFDPHDNWLPPCFYVPKELEEALIDSDDSWDYTDKQESTCLHTVIPYNLVTQHSIPDKSIADCVEALIGAYLIECGPRGALLFMSWLGIHVLPHTENGFGEIKLPRSPLSNCSTAPEDQLDILLNGYDKFEEHIGYQFRDRSYLLQALTHASFSSNTLTDCYQRLEFLGDAVLDYVITRHLYEDSRMHSPGALTDLRSALVNNTIFASLAVRNNFHKYFKNFSPTLNEVIERFVRLQTENGHTLVDELYLGVEAEEGAEDVEVPKALGDIFESVAGAIFLDSEMSLDAVWGVYYNMMKTEIEQFSNKVPKSPIRELLELEPETAKFSKPEKLADGRRVRVTVEVFGKGLFKGIGRNYRIAKCTAAKCALKNIRKRTIETGH